jgi:hypothetical protein
MSDPARVFDYPTPDHGQADIPPHSVEAEQAVLGACLLDAAAPDRVRGVIAAEDFYRADHRVIFGAIERVRHEDGDPDVLTVAEALRAADELDRCGGLAYLQDLASCTPSAANVAAYASIVADKARRRALAAAGERLRIAAMKPGADLEELVREATARITSAAAGASGSGIDIIRGDAIQPEAVRWAWPGFVPYGKLVIIGGAPENGKTCIALGLGAAVTCGGRLPDGSTAPVGDVLIWSGEDGIADTLAPRLIACGADMKRVHFLHARREGERRRPFDPARDFPALAERASQLPGLRLAIVDPLVMAVSGDSHKNAEVRRGLQPLVDFAAAAGCAILGVTHFTKGTAGREPLERITGSLAFGALARVVLVTAKEPAEQGGARLLLRAKSNLGPSGGGFRYELCPVTLDGPHAGIPAVRPEYLGAIEGTARDILAAAEASEEPEEKSARAEAVAFLRDTLAGGPVPSKRIIADARACGIAEKTLRRAKSDLGIEAVKEAMGSGWLWTIPAKMANFTEQETWPSSGKVATLEDGQTTFEDGHI